MPNEYMLLVRNKIAHLAHLSATENAEFLDACRTYISKLKADGKLIAAQPLVREGVILSGNGTDWATSPFNEAGEVQVGYYHILADSFDEAVEIAKGNPEFRYTDSARVEVRPIKGKEQSTGFVYPNTQN